MTSSRAGWLRPDRVRADLIAPGGVYVCGSLKEEFGLALIEALAAGLVVVAPDGGGPATYIDEGVHRVPGRHPLAAAVGAGIAAAFDLAGRPDDDERVRRSQQLVAERFTMQAMARALAGVTAPVVAPSGGGWRRHDAAGDQPGLRLSSTAAGHPGHRLAGRRRTGGGGQRSGDRDRSPPISASSGPTSGSAAGPTPG